MSIEWNDSFNLGDDELNAQHKLLFRLVNEVLNARNKAELTGCLIHLFKYTREHFAYEEALMRKVNFDEYDHHVLMHEQLTTRLGSLGWHISNDTLDKDELEIFIKDWALNHIPNADARLSKFLLSAK